VVVFPAKPRAVIRGIPTVHSDAPLKKEISSGEDTGLLNNVTGVPKTKERVMILKIFFYVFDIK
jgi:hypothetical protein